MRTSSEYAYAAVIPVPVAKSFPSAGVADVTVGAVASKTFACPGVPFGQTVSKREAPVCAEYQFAPERPSPGVSLRSMDTTPESDPAGNGLAFARS